jgi:ferredoxin, 2Fe-2S
MARIVFITTDGQERPVDASDGSLMEAAVASKVPGIEGLCGGVCSCTTCHVHVDPQWADRVGPPGEEEKGLLDFTDHATAHSRLGCQVNIGPELDGLKVRVVGS